MKITIITLGSRGDVQPCIAFGIGLKKAGHEVRIAAPKDYGYLAQDVGLDFFPIENGFRQIYKMEPGRNRLQEELHPTRILYRRKHVVGPIVHRIFSDLWSACGNTDVVFYTVLALPVYYLAKDRGLPAFPICFQPLCRTSSYPSLLFQSRLKRSGVFNLASHLLVEQVIWHFHRSYFNQWRREKSLSPVPFWGHLNQSYFENAPIFHAFSNHIFPKPVDWGDRSYVTGFWLMAPSPQWRPDPKLVDFLASGEKPVCVGFGSMNDNRTAERVRLTLEAARKAGKRVVFLTGQSDVNPTELPESDDVFVAHEVPHSWLFPRVSAVLHHGGAGTTSAALKAGVPSIIIPFFFDQHFWGNRLMDLEVGLPPVTKNMLSIDHLSSAIRHTVGNEDFKRRLLILQKQIGEEDGVENAVNAFENELSQIEWSTEYGVKRA